VQTITPEGFGAIGDGTTDDTGALQAAVNALDSVKGGTIWIAKDYNFSTLNITGQRVTITGPGKLRNGTIYVGVQSGFNPVFMWTRISCRFDRNTRSTTVNAIEIANSYNVDIEGCEVANYRALVHFPSLSLGGTNIQHAARIKLSGCYTPFFAAGSTTVAAIDYLVYVSANVTGGLFAVGDLTVVDNPSVQADIAHIWGYQLDGLTCSGNTFFHLGYNKSSPRKLHCIYLNFCDWINITGNQLFEAGFEAVNLTDARNIIIQGNNIAWPGQRDLKDAIALTISSGGYSRGIITGNNISYYTLSAVGIYGAGNATGLTLGHNSCYSANTNTAYYGTTTLPTTFTRYTAVAGLAGMPRLTDPTGFYDASTTLDNIGGTALESFQRLGTRSSLTVRGKTVTFSASTAATAGSLSGANASNSIYGGQIDLFVQDGTATHCAHYLLTVAKSATSGTLTTVSANGETTGATAAAPSFTFALSGDNIVATPVGSTAGTFAFYATSLGNVRFL
jgi:hypothetical protein